MNILMGIGNEINGDDAAGVFIAKRFSAKGWKSINCETVPENFLGVIKREKPELLVLVDATEMELEPGEIRLISKNRLNSEVDSTHSLSLHFLVSELEKHAGKILFIGIQPESMETGEEMSPAVASSAGKLLKILQKAGFSGIKTL
ncbi:MAG: hydrogenase maturation peptidase HycI [Candidatus Aenigmarchaeota archaeon]|nr:hydrogenase maturation peptidase HycI [Candidatus Aenigmarchaeota archaeon]